HKIDNRAGGATSGEEIVRDDDAMTIADRVAMDLQGVLTILKIVRNRCALSRQLAWLAHRHKPCPEVISERGRKDKSARFDSDYRINFLPFKLRRERVDRVAQSFRMLEQSGDVIKIDAGLGKVRHFADQRF